MPPPLAYLPERAHSWVPATQSSGRRSVAMRCATVSQMTHAELMSSIDEPMPHLPSPQQWRASCRRQRARAVAGAPKRWHTRPVASLARAGGGDRQAGGWRSGGGKFYMVLQ
ncbi:hypothetical protein PVAP13_3KG427201 [Panicum virgatum]|uniref:Uncharacterized protein n=1 Tax=Panicum virgatum TaxID=38727 RepID=A0A8T0V2I0_PANVG|nr:hypothetical protein PVAP13_3KG427201 [Panicum virgatum]